jgi:hypothetical protein
MATTAAQTPPGKTRSHIAPSSRELDAAARLGAVFRELYRMHETPLGHWAVIPEKGYGDNYHPFYTALGTVYGTDTERQNRYGRANYQSRVMLYKKDCDTVMPLVIESTLQFALVGLNAEIAALRKLYERLTSEPGIAQRLHRESEELVAAFEREKRKAEAARAGEPPPSDDAPVQRQASISYLTPREIDEIFRQKVAPMVAYAGHDVLSILFGHPEGRQIIAAYAESAGRGTVASSRRVLDAIWAVVQFSQTAVNERRAIRYPFFVIGGVARLGLEEVPDFREFAVSYCQALQRDVREKVLMFAGGAVAIFALVLAGPGVAAAVAAVLLAGTDLAFAGYNASLAYAREREQDLANRASRFKGQGKEWATPVVYQDTIMAGAAALLSGIAFFGSVKELRQVLNARKEAASAVRAPRQEPPAPTAPRSDAQKLDRSTVGKRGVVDDHDPERWREFLAEAKKRNEAGRDKSLRTDDRFTYEGPEVRSTYHGPDLQANANRSRGTPRPETGAPARATQEPMTGEPALEAPTSTSSRATKPAQKAVPPITLYRSVQDRLKGRGGWKPLGNLNVNTGGWTVKKGLGPANRMTWEQFEEAANREIFERFAEEISDKPVRTTIPGSIGYSRASTLSSNELKLQKEFRGRLGGGITFIRRPDASMEVVEKSAGKKAGVTQVHFLESTLQNDFEAEIGYAGGKQRQVSGTVWLSNKIPKYRYTEDTRLVYNIFCPEAPSPRSIEFLNSLAAETPNLEINWIVVQ